MAWKSKASIRNGLREFALRMALGKPMRETLAALADLRDFTPAEIAYLEGVSPRTLEDWRESGEGPRFRKTRRERGAPVRYPISEYLRWRTETVFSHTAPRKPGGRS